MTQILPNILSPSSLKNIEEFWSPDKERRISGNINGHKRDIVMLTHEDVVALTGDDLAGYHVHSGFLGLAGEPYKIHCDLGNNPITHNLCINLLPDDQVGNQSLILFDQRTKYRMILVNDDTPADVIAEYVRVQYIPVSSHNISSFVTNLLPSPNVDPETFAPLLVGKHAQRELKRKLLPHTWASSTDKLSIEQVIPHRYNQGIEFDAHTLHCGGYAEGDHKRMVLYVRKIDE